MYWKLIVVLSLKLVLQGSWSSDIESPILRTEISNCSCEWVLVLGTVCLISVPGSGQLFRFLNLNHFLFSQVSAVPTVISFKDGSPADKFIGLKDDDQLDSFVAKLL